MNINDVVAHALKIRNQHDDHTRYALDANLDRNEVILTVYPFNGMYIERAVGAYKFFILNGAIKTVWITHG